MQLSTGAEVLGQWIQRVQFYKSDPTALFASRLLSSLATHSETTRAKAARRRRQTPLRGKKIYDLEVRHILSIALKDVFLLSRIGMGCGA